jgi:catechol 2,3-dioxygenase-like lactoylglutathione lyase family enzyme
VSLKHVTVRVPDLHHTSQFYRQFFGMPLRQQSAKVHILGVGQSFLGIAGRQSVSNSATVDHYDFGIADFSADEVRARLSELHLNFSDKTAKESFKFVDPDGFHVQVNALNYVGHVS